MNEATDFEIDAVYNLVDYLLIHGQFAAVDGMLENLRIDELPTDILLSYLTITWPASNKLRTRPHFCRHCEQEFKKRHPADYLSLMGNLASER